MNKQPVSYLQTDPRWASMRYALPGEHSTIGSAGCGPTAMAMVLATWADPKVTPETECAWSLANGGKAFNQGTYYSYFPKAAARYGLSCTQLNGGSLYGNAGSGLHAQVVEFLEQGDLIIACMGPGTWTRSGHFVVLWRVENGVAYINDPASTAARRVRGNWAEFRSQVKYYFRIRRPASVSGSDTEEKEMSNLEIINLVNETVKSEVLAAEQRILKAMVEAIPAEPVYNSIEEIPESWPLAREAVQAAVDLGALQGTGHGLELTLTMLRMIVVDYRTRKALEIGLD